MGHSEFEQWVDRLTRGGADIFAKRLAANDTLASGGHQAGPYIPKSFLFRVLREIHQPDQLNPDVWFPVTVVSHGDERTVRAVWYNNRFFDGTRNEARLTNFGGSASPLLEPRNTGALTLFAFQRTDAGPTCEVWVCKSRAQECVAEGYLGPVEPGSGFEWEVGRRSPRLRSRRPTVATPPEACRLAPAQIPKAWLSEFPSGAEIVRKALDLLPGDDLTPDDRLVRRRACEFGVFLSLEEATVLPVINKGFGALDDFVAFAHTVLQRRRARSGKSLELHMKEILTEEGLVEGTDFDYNVESEPRRRPDFLFPSGAAYADRRFPATRLHMLAAKTTCKDRWRQVLNEAARIPTKHLLTLQEGVSEQQHAEMRQSGVKLVVPESLHPRFPAAVRPDILRITDFLRELERTRV